MSIPSILNTLETAIDNSYTAIATKGGTIPQNKNTNNLMNAIDSIPASSTTLNIFIQNSQPSGYDGIWIADSTYANYPVIEIDNYNSKQANSINILKGDVFSTKLFNDNSTILSYHFGMIFVTDSNGNVVTNIDRYYGNGNSWVQLISFIPVQYLQTTGTQYIETGITPNNTIKAQFKVNMQNVTSGCIFGLNSGSEATAFRFFSVDHVYYLDYGGGNQHGRISGGTFNTDTDYNLEIGNKYIKNLDTGTNIISGSATGSFDYTSYIIRIFNTSNYGKIYYCKIYKNNAIVRDYIPVKDLNGVGCLYDRVTNTLFYNAGTGDFVIGE